MNFKMVACDLDYTLLMNDHQTISPYNVNAIWQASRNGMLFVVATGRNLGMLPESIFSLPLNYAIIANGAICYELAPLKKIIDSPIKKTSINRTLSILTRNPEIMVEMYNERYIFVDERFNWDNVMTGHRCAVNFDNVINVTNWENFDLNKDIYKINVPQFLDKELYDEILSELVEDKHLHISRSERCNIEISSYGVNKGTALQKICEITKVDIKSVISFGDSGNDLEMISDSGCGVAMKNADPRIKDLANFVTASFVDDGVGKFLNLLQ